jgi:lipid A 3-O-deacylase
MKTERERLYFSLRFFLLMIITILFFSVKSPAGEATTQPSQGKSGLSKHPWQVGVFMQGGFPRTYEVPFSSSQTMNVQLGLISAGIEAGKQTRRLDGPKPLRGRGEAMLEIMPFWMAHYPNQTITITPANQVIPFSMASSSFHGASVTPFLLRWNFSQRDSARIVPWAQLGCGLLWTNHKFPIVIVPTDPHAGTSVINFTPQIGAGVNIFNKPKHSVNLAMKMIHISNAGLGDHNPGLHDTLQFSAGYSWWR